MPIQRTVLTAPYINQSAFEFTYSASTMYSNTDSYEFSHTSVPSYHYTGSGYTRRTDVSLQTVSKDGYGNSYVSIEKTAFQTYANETGATTGPDSDGNGASNETGADNGNGGTGYTDLTREAESSWETSSSGNTNGDTGSGSESGTRTFVHYPQETTLSTRSVGFTTTVSTSRSFNLFETPALHFPSSILYDSTYTYSAFSGFSTVESTSTFYTESSLSSNSSTWVSVNLTAAVMTVVATATRESTYTIVANASAAVTENGRKYVATVIECLDGEVIYVAPARPDTFILNQASDITTATSTVNVQEYVTFSKFIPITKYPGVEISKTIPATTVTYTFNDFAQNSFTETRWNYLEIPNSSYTVSGQEVYYVSSTSTSSRASFTTAFMMSWTVSTVTTNYDSVPNLYVTPHSTAIISLSMTNDRSTAVTSLTKSALHIFTPEAGSVLNDNAFATSYSSSYSYVGGTWGVTQLAGLSVTGVSEGFASDGFYWRSGVTGLHSAIAPATQGVGVNVPLSSVNSFAMYVGGGIGTTLKGLSVASVSEGVYCLLPLPTQTYVEYNTYTEMTSFFGFPIVTTVTATEASKHSTFAVSLAANSISWQKYWMVASGSETVGTSTSSSGILSQAGSRAAGFSYAEVWKGSFTLDLSSGLWVSTVNNSTGSTEGSTFLTAHKTLAISNADLVVVSYLGRCDGEGIDPWAPFPYLRTEV